MGRFGIVKRNEPITVEELKQKFPAKKNTITEETAEYLNDVMSNPDFDSAMFLSQLVDYQSVMLDTSTSFTEYVNAVKFCAYLETNNCSLVDAYRKARANDEFVQERATATSGTAAYNELTNQASRYRKSKLVRQLLIQSDMPLYLMFQAERYKAVAVLAKEMESAPFSKDRISAAKELLANVKPPENMQIELGIGLNKEAQDTQGKLFEQLARVAYQQQQLMELGGDLKYVQRVGINLNEVTDVEVGDE